MADLQRIKETAEDIIKKMEELESKLESFTKDLKFCSEENEDMKDICTNMCSYLKPYRSFTQKTRESMQTDKEQFTNEEHSSKAEACDELACDELKIPVNIHIFENGSGNDIKNLRANLIEKLEESIKESSYQMNVIPCRNLSEVRSEIPLLVLCIAASRVGSDAEEAIKGLSNLSKTMLLIFHPQSFPVQDVKSSELVLIDEQFRNLGGILDFLYDSEKNVIYSCKTNKISLKSVIDFVRKFIIVHL